MVWLQLYEGLDLVDSISGMATQLYESLDLMG